METWDCTYKIAARCAVSLAFVSLGAHLFRGALMRIFHGHWGKEFVLGLLLSTVVLFIGWFLLATVILKVQTRGDLPNQPSRSQLTQSASIGRTVGIAASMALVVALTAWLALDANDEIFFSRLLAWIAPLIYFQGAGFDVASRLFPCRLEGSSFGCEPYKWLPAFLLSNAAAYFPILLSGTFVYSRSQSIRAGSERFFRLFIRYGVVLASVGLALRIVLCWFTPDVSSPNRVHDLMWFGWILVDMTAGALSVGLVLVVPFSIWRTVRAAWKQTNSGANLVDLTWLASFGVVALTIGDQYRY